jgi:hypothetical protein
MILSKRHYLMVGGPILLALALGVAATSSAKRPEAIVVPESTTIHVTLDQALTSNHSRPGDHFQATVSEPVIINGKTVIPEGASAKGLVVDAHQSGRLMGRARLQLALESVSVDGRSYPVSTASRWRTGLNHKKCNWLWIGGGAGGGALIGAIAGGGEGALIGGPVGAGAGTMVAILTGRKDIHLHPETPLTFQLAKPLTVPVNG